MVYTELPLHPRLQDHVQLLWMMESENEPFPKEQILPDGIVELVFHYKDPYITYPGSGKPFKQPRSFAISQMRQCIEIESDGETGFFAVRFYPWGAHHYFDYPVQNFLDQTVAASQLWPDRWEALEMNIAKAQDYSERSAMIEEFLLECRSLYEKPDAPLEQAIKLIRETKGELSMEEVGERTGLAKKQLERKFKNSVGTTPKVFARVSRLLNICRHLEDYQNQTLTQLAAACGYYDQAHFIKEFKTFCGFTPKAFFKKNNVVFADL